MKTKMQQIEEYINSLEKQSLSNNCDELIAIGGTSQDGSDIDPRLNGIWGCNNCNCVPVPTVPKIPCKSMN